MEWNEIDRRLAALGKDRTWLAESVGYSAASVREALAPNSRKRSEKLLRIIERAIEDEESRQRPSAPREIRPGVFEIFDLSTPEGEAEFDVVDRASRIVQAPSITDYCHDVLLAASERILAKERLGLYGEIPGIFPNAKVAEMPEPTGSTGAPNPVEPDPFPSAGAASGGTSSPGESASIERGNGTNA